MTDTVNVPREAWGEYKRSQIAQLRPYVSGETLSERVSISMADLEAGSPKAGDMIARNPANHDDQWLVAAEYFSANFEPAMIAAAPKAEPVRNAQQLEGDDAYLLAKRDLYYRPNASGYTGIKDNAGRYTKAEAESHADPISGVSMVLADEAPEFTGACFEDVARAHLQKKLDEARAELAVLRSQPASTKVEQEAVRRLAIHLAKSIANLGYPVGMGISPPEEECVRAAEKIIRTYTAPPAPASDELLETLKRADAAIGGADISKIRRSEGGVDLAKKVVDLKAASQNLLDKHKGPQS